jgi:hypothetical protein
MSYPFISLTCNLELGKEEEKMKQKDKEEGMK